MTEGATETGRESDRAGRGSDGASEFRPPTVGRARRVTVPRRTASRRWRVAEVPDLPRRWRACNRARMRNNHWRERCSGRPACLLACQDCGLELRSANRNNLCRRSTIPLTPENGVGQDGLAQDRINLNSGRGVGTPVGRGRKCYRSDRKRGLSSLWWCVVRAT